MMYKETINNSITEKNKGLLTDYYSKDVNALRQLTGKSFENWSV